MRGDDLVDLLRPAPDPAVGLRQGVITAFDQTTGQNTVNVAGGVLTNLPILSGSESLEYAPGDVVVLLRLRSSWCILGRIVVPGATLAPSALSIDSFTTQGNGFTLDTFGAGGLVKASGTLTVPPWANRAAVLALGTCVGKQPTSPPPANEFMTTHITIAGQADANKPQGWVEAANHVVFTYPSLSRVLSVAGGSTITCAVEMWASSTWGTNSSNYARLHALGTFSRV